jgi:hypothetical protein
MTPTDVKKGLPTKTKRGYGVMPTTASISDDGQNKYAAVHYAVMPPGMIGSVLVSATDAASLKTCLPTATAFLDSLAIDTSSATGGDPEARVETVVGRWANAGHEYTFSADGTYRFHAETSPKPDQYRVVDETGAYTAVGNQLTLAPTAATSAVTDKGTTGATTKIALEKVTYTWSKTLVGTDEWQIVLAPLKKTTRDGEFSTNPRYATSYVYSATFKPEWKVARP